jgi:hypothetical protein
MKRRAWKTVALSVLFFSVLFVVFGGLGLSYSARDVTFLAVIGAFIGALAAPEFEPESFSHPSLWQATFGAMGGLSIAGLLNPVPVAFVAGGMIGIIIGYTASYWVKHVQVP